MNNFDLTTSNWVLVSVLHALYNSGTFKYLHEKSGPHSISEIALTCHVKGAELKACLAYVSMHLPELVDRLGDDVFSLTAEYDSDLFQNLLHFTLAYAPAVQSLGSLLTGEKEYGRDLERNSRSVGISSEIYSKNAGKQLADLVEFVKPEVVIDIGCGTGHLVEVLAERFGCIGYAIDDVGIHEDAASSNVHYLTGDALLPKEWCSNIPKGRLVLVASMVMHELLRNGISAFVKTLNEYSDVFPNAHLFIVEYNAYSDKELMHMPEHIFASASMYQFLHPLTKQGSPQSKEEWRSIFKRSKLVLLDEKSMDPNLTVYHLKL